MKVSRVAVLALAVGQVISPVVSQVVGADGFTVADRVGEPPIVPVGWAFSIWGLIEVLSVAYAVWALRQPDDALLDALSKPLIGVFAGFSVWIVAAAVEPVWTTVAVFLVMLACLLWALRIALAHREEIAGWSRLGRVLLWGTLGVYTGWSSIAVWVNLTTALAASGAPITGTAGVVGQVAILAGATATGVAILRWTRGLLPYAAAVVWAFTGAAIGAGAAGEPVLAMVAGAGLAVVVLATARLARHRLPDIAR